MENGANPYLPWFWLTRFRERQMTRKSELRDRVVVLGDQLDLSSRALRELDPARDEVWMAEVTSESTHVASHKARTVLFLSAMRHFRDELQARGISVRYQELSQAPDGQTLGQALQQSLRSHPVQRLIWTEPGEFRVAQELYKACNATGTPHQVLPDDSFLISTEDFAAYVGGRNSLRMEFFYREMRRRTGVLMRDGSPIGGQWNFDRENRGSFGQEGPKLVHPPIGFEPDALTLQVIREVEIRFPGNPGKLGHFDWPVNRAQALEALSSFIVGHLAHFGTYQDAMWVGQPYLHHSRLSVVMNLKLLRPIEVIEQVEAAHRAGRVPIASAEGFIRQILGWREYVRGIYHHFMPEYLERNALKATASLPEFFWNAETPMNCLREAIGQTLEYGYAHHIQRLMITGLYCLLLGVDPKEVHRWYLAVYVDAVEWVELPNTLGMSQYADGGIMASKPYIASGKYIQRMSNYCEGCKFRPDVAVGENACPFTTLYWDFIDRHRKVIAGNPRMGAQAKNWDRFTEEKKQGIREQARRLKGGDLGSRK